MRKESLTWTKQLRLWSWA